MQKISIQSIAIGSFDGIHLAHQTLIKQVDALVIIERNTGYLTAGYKRSLFTKKLCCFYHFEKISSLTPLEFVTKLQKDFPLLEKIVVGYDFSFGHKKSGSIKELKTFFQAEVCVIEEVCLDGIPIHSRTIKNALKEGDIFLANRLLGRDYTIEGELIKGQGLGKKSLVPTLNVIVSKGYQLPLSGVYATKTYINHQWFSSITFLGHRVTTDGEFAVESYVIDEVLENAPKNIEIQFLKFIRTNRKFESLESLKRQIEEDIKEVKNH